MTDLEASNVVVWPKWCYTNNPMEGESSDLVSNNNNSSSFNNNHKSLSASLKEKYLTEAGLRHRKKPRTHINGVCKDVIPTSNGMSSESHEDVKKERVSPEPDSASSAPASEQQPHPPPPPPPPPASHTSHTSPTPSTSPKSPSSMRARTPSLSANSPNPGFTPPTSSMHPLYERFSPAALGPMAGLPNPGHGGAMKQMETLISRNCSDLMRSLAAKYNNSAPNDYFSNPNHNSLRSSMNNMNALNKTPNPYIGVHSPGTRDMDKKMSDAAVSAAACLPPGMAGPTSPMFSGAGIPGFPGFPLVDMSSTQVLLNMVRNASAAQQTQLENYLKGAMKRPADSASSPLDLSSSVAAKRPRTDFGPKAFDVKSFFSLPQEEDKKSDKGSPSPPVKTRPTCVTPNKVNFLCNDTHCPSLHVISQWTVDDVCSFVKSIDLCAEYSEVFREQRIDGSSLPLLTEEHLTTSINMKLGPALKLKAVLARKLGACQICLHCSHCHSPPTDRRASSTSTQ